jgi:hypothetical protein
MDQSVMVFADSSARSSAIPSPSEGMLTYLEDTDAVEKYDGSAFVNVAPGGLVAVKEATKTDVFSASVSAGASIDITGLSITHAMGNADNRLILTASMGYVGNTGDLAQTGIAFHDGTDFLLRGDAAGSRTRVLSGGRDNGAGAAATGQSYASQFIHSPGTTSSITYTLRAINVDSSTRTVRINRDNDDDSDRLEFARAASIITLMEVAV